MQIFQQMKAFSAILIILIALRLEFTHTDFPIAFWQRIGLEILKTQPPKGRGKCSFFAVKFSALA